jgi:WD40 repeat protein
VPVSALAFTPDGRLLVTGDTAGQVHLWDMTDDMRKATWAVSEYPVEHGAVRGLAISPDGAVVALAQDMLRICRLTDGEILSVLAITGAGESTDFARPQAVVFAPDGATIAVGYNDGSVHLVARATGEVERSFSAEEPVAVLAFSPDGASIVIGGNGGTVQLWGLGEGDTARTLPGHGSPVQGLAFGADSSTFVVSTADGVVQQWRVAP